MLQYMNITNTTVIFPKNDSVFELNLVDYTLLSLYVVVITIGVFGNIMVIKWFYVDSKRKKPGSMLVIALAVNDLLASMVAPPFEISTIIFGNICTIGKGLCKTLPALYSMLFLATPWFLVTIATERFR